MSQQETYLIIVDDDRDDRELMHQIFSDLNWQHHVTFLEDGDQLFDFLETIPSYDLPSLIILDYNMPRLGGETALMLLKKDPRYKNIPVSIYSTSNLKNKEKSLYIIGAYSIRQKPGSLQAYKSMMAECKNYILSTRLFKSPGYSSKQTDARSENIPEEQTGS